jgi:myo-inositol catabolism protein IolC
VERILAAQAKPRSAMEALAIDARDQLDEVLRQTPLAPRPTADYQRLLEETAQSDATDESEDNGPDDPTA